MTRHAPIGNLHSQERSEGERINEQRDEASFSLCCWATAPADGENIQQPRPEQPGPSLGKDRGERETLQPGIVSCHILLICQCSGLFLERLELAARNRTAINLGSEWNAGGGRCCPSCTGSWDADGLETVPEQVMEQWSDSTRYSI